ncbi:MAG: signal recognition particle-docking protein FtsY [Gemmatimonadetes bacterium]|nr:signal recognition particle-docking protein FtsY [Gemmatimonadota bacterium]
MGRGLRRLKESLVRTSGRLTTGVRSIFAGRDRFDEEMWEELEELLISADVGAVTADELVEELRRRSRKWSRPDPEDVLVALRDLVSERLGGDEPEPLRLDVDSPPAVVLVIGVNGAGKTTTIAKLAAKLRAEGRKVLLVAGDTFRMAAMEQLATWAERVEVPIVKGQEGQDAAAVVFDGLEAGRSRGVDVILVDTAGRLHTKSGLMEELKKVRRVLEKHAGAPHETLLVLDATMGQNALQQARVFGADLGITGLVLAKLDGTAKGGVVLAIQRELSVPVKLIGVGEKVDDLQVFDPKTFASALVPVAEPTS